MATAITSVLTKVPGSQIQPARMMPVTMAQAAADPTAAAMAAATRPRIKYSSK